MSVLDHGNAGRLGIARPPTSAMSSLKWIAILSGICIACGIGARVAAGVGQPLWLDEAWSGAIVTQPDFAQVVHQIYLDVNAPIYFIVLLGWTKIAGISDFALRFPSFLFSAAIPFLVLLARRKELGARESWIWATLLALWFPGIWYAQNARCYALLMFIATAQALLFIRLIASPRLGTATAWTACSAALILTHYDAALVTACQGVIYLAVHQWRAVRTWPALLAFAPTLAWGLYHWPRLVEFARPDVAWYSVLGIGTLPKILTFVIGLAPMTLLALAAVVAVMARKGSPIAPSKVPTEGSTALPLYCAAAASVAALVLFVAIGFMRPIFDARYLVPMIPGVMLGVVLVLRPFARRWQGVHLTVMLVYLATSVAWTAMAASHTRTASFEAAAHLFEQKGVRTLAFTMDSPGSVILKPSQFVAIADFFFKRDAYPMEIQPVFLRPGDDASRKLLAAVAADPHGAILWLYDLRVHDTVASESPPRIVQIAPSWRCRDFGRGPIGTVACWNTAGGGGEEAMIRGSIGSAAGETPLIGIRPAAAAGRPRPLTPASDSWGSRG